MSASSKARMPRLACPKQKPQRAPPKCRLGYEDGEEPPQREPPLQPQPEQEAVEQARKADIN